MRRFVIVQSQSDVLHLAAALSHSSGFAGLLDGWQKERNQDRNDGDHDEKFNQSEAATHNHDTEALQQDSREAV